MEKPTHSKCKGHNTRLATPKELQEINKINGTSFMFWCEGVCSKCNKNEVCPSKEIIET